MRMNQKRQIQCKMIEIEYHKSKNMGMNTKMTNSMWNDGNLK